MKQKIQRDMGVVSLLFRVSVLNVHLADIMDICSSNVTIFTYNFNSNMLKSCPVIF